MILQQVAQKIPKSGVIVEGLVIRQQHVTLLTWIMKDIKLWLTNKAS